MSTYDPQKHGWWPASVADWDCHYGTRNTSTGLVDARCGLSFLPLAHGITGEIFAWRSPADPEHGCPECVKLADDN